MTDVEQYRRKSNDLLKQAVRARNVSVIDQLLGESMMWSQRATAAERAARGSVLPSYPSVAPNA
ncbi:MAG TPA: hypothetical protein VMU59_12850 [Caulobacteraceae bacterium]|nr:hypothetical protein [Caulobacteraceae bacterium]